MWARTNAYEAWPTRINSCLLSALSFAVFNFVVRSISIVCQFGHYRPGQIKTKRPGQISDTDYSVRKFYLDH